MLSKLLDRFNVKYEDLNAAERETLEQWYKTLASKELTVSDIKDHVANLIHAVELELADYNLPKEKDLLLKARIRNYLMLHDFLSAPDKARRHIEQSLQNIK